MLKHGPKHFFIQKLNDEDLSINERLLLAYGALISCNFPLVGKEQVIIDWFAGRLKTNGSYIKTTVKTLIKCFKSDWLLTYLETLDPSKLVEALSELDDETKCRNSKILLRCQFMILQNAGFQRYSRFDILPMVSAILFTCELMCNVASNKENLDDTSDSVDATGTMIDSKLEELIDYILHLHKVTLQRSELKVLFVRSILPVLLTFQYNFHESAKFQSLLEEVIISENPETLCKAFKSGDLEKMPEHLKALVKQLDGIEHPNNVVALNSLIFNVFVQSCLKRPGDTSHISLFLILSSVTGFELQLPCNVLVGSCDQNVKLLILRDFLTVLQKLNIPASSQTEEGVLSNYLVVILKDLISGEHQLSSDLLEVIQAILKVNPECVKLVFPNFVKNIVFVKKGSKKVMKMYNSLFCDVVKIFVDLNQLEKFFSLFFQTAVSHLNSTNLSNLTEEMVLSNGFFLLLSEKLSSLTGNQIRNIIGRLVKIFLKSFVVELENNLVPDNNFGLVLQLLVQIICHLLENSYIVMSSRWNIINDEIQNFIGAVQRFGIAILTYPETKFLQEFLYMVRILNILELAVNQYVVSLSSVKIIPAVKCKDKSNSVNNLSKTHGFLLPSEWNRVSDLVQDSCDENLRQCWWDLLLQKYMRLEDPKVATYLVLTADNEWLWRSLPHLSCSVSLKHMELLSERLLTSGPITADKLAALGNIDVITNRAMSAALIMQSLKLMSDILPDKKAITKKIMKLIDKHSVIKHEEKNGQDSQEIIETLSTILGALAEVLNKLSIEEETMLLENDRIDQLASYVGVLNVMGPFFMKAETKQMIFLVLMGFTFDLKEHLSLHQSILEILLGYLDDTTSPFPESLDRRVVVSWVSVVPTTFPHERTAAACAVVAKLKHSLYQDVSDMSHVIRSNSELLCAMLDIAVQVHGNKGFAGSEYFHKSVRSLVSYASKISCEEPKLEFINPYTAALKANAIILKERSLNLLQHLQTYLKLSFQSLTERTHVDSKASELIEFTFSLKSDIEPNVLSYAQKSMTKELCSVECHILIHPSTVKAFLESLEADQYGKILNKIHQHQKKTLMTNPDFSLGHLCQLWCLVVAVQVNKEKSVLRHKLLIKVLTECQIFSEKQLHSSQNDIPNLLYSICTNKSVVLTPKLVDLTLVILGNIPVNSEPQLLPECLSVLNVLINHHAELIFDRIPAFLQRLRKFIKSLVMSSPETEVYNTLTTSSVNQVTRIIKTITDQHSTHFSRIAPYFIADMLHWLVSFPIESSVKNELQNSVCSLLVICDHHATHLLQNLLPMASTELFKALSSTFRKSFKYTGKV